MSPVESRPARSILFICIGNACRSPMAEAMARATFPAWVTAESAGIQPLGRVPAETFTMLQELGADGTGLSSKPITDAALRRADLLIDLAGYYSPSRIFTGTLERWPVEDPYRMSLSVWRLVRTDIQERVRDLAARWLPRWDASA